MLICEAVEPDGKSCSKCGQYKPVNTFYRNSKCHGGYNTICKPCEKGPVEEARLRRVYGLSFTDWEALWEAQNGKCPICSRDLIRGVDTVVDHDHTTGKVRALLNSTCNQGLGSYYDNPAWLRAAAGYLETHHASPD